MTNFDPSLFDSSLFSVPSIQEAQTSARKFVRRKKRMAHRERTRMVEDMISARKDERRT